jgi:hypothetical protein
LEDRNQNLLQNKQKLDLLPEDDLARYKLAKQNKNIFDDEEIEEISTPAVMESSRNEVT